MMGEIKPFNSIGHLETEIVNASVWPGPLSGYLAGKERGGYFVQKLEDEWATAFGTKHAIAVNSATSGLLAAAFAVDLKPNDWFLCPAMTMSATVAAPMFTGARPWFCDVDDETFSLHEGGAVRQKAVFATNLFGHPAHLSEWRKTCDDFDMYLIEDNAQSPFAMQGDKYAGTIGHIGVFSLNVHKPLQCGEGGIVVTDDDELSRRIRLFINHGETVCAHIGLNLRMPEVCAAIALAQLRRGKEIVDGRVKQAADIIAVVGDIKGLRPPVTREGCTHVYYTVPFLVAEGRRKEFCAALRADGVPVVEGYGEGPIYNLPAFSPYKRPCPVAENLHDHRLFYIENCAHDFSPEQIEKIGDAFRRAAGVL